VDEIGLTSLDERRCGALPAEALPRVIEFGAEIDRAVAQLERLDFARRTINCRRSLRERPRPS
jgi:hypothetical protein